MSKDSEFRRRHGSAASRSSVSSSGSPTSSGSVGSSAYGSVSSSGSSRSLEIPGSHHRSDSGASSSSSTSSPTPGGDQVNPIHPAFTGCSDNGDCIIKYIENFKKNTRNTGPEESIRNQTAFKLCVDMIRTVDDKKKPKKVYRFSQREFYKALRKHLGCITVTDEKGLNLLAVIIMEGRIDFLCMLLYCGILTDMLEVKISSEVNSRFSGMTPKDIISKYNMTKMKDELDVLQRLEKSLTPLHAIARSGDVDAVKFALERHPQMIETPARDGSNALLWGVTSGSLEVVKMLVSEGGDVHKRTYDDESLLGRAVYCGHIDIIKYLINESLLDADEVCRDGSTPIEIALDNFDKSTLEVLIECGVKMSKDIIPKVASLGRLDLWKYICSVMRDFSVNHRDKYGKSPLYITVEKNYNEIVKDIMTRKGDLKTKDRLDRNLLFAAIDSGNEEMFKYVLQSLKSRGLLRSLINEKDLYCGKERLFTVTGRDNGILGYHFVEVRRIYLDIFSRRVRGGGQMDVAKYAEVLKSGWGSPPQAEREDVQKRYDTSLINPADRDPDMTPLLYAILERQTKMAVALIEAGADVNMTDKFGNQPIHLAAMRGDQVVIDKLEGQNINLSFPGDQENTPLQIAELNNHMQVCNSLESVEFIEDNIESIKKHRAEARKLLDQLDERNLHRERRRGTNIKQYIISKCRDVQSEVNNLLYQLGTTQIQQASE